MQQENKYNPAACDHKLPNGLGSWMFHSESSGSGPDMYHDVHVSVCIMCGTIRIGGFRSDNEGKLNRFNEEFSIHAAEAIDAMIKYANYIHEEKVWGRLTKRPAGAEWVKASVRLPVNSDLIHLNYRTDNTNFKTTGYYEPSVKLWYNQSGTPLGWAPNLEWLDESGQSKEGNNTSKPTFWEVAEAFKWAAEYRDEIGGQLTLYNDQWTLISEDEDGNENETQDLTSGNVAELYCLQKGFEKEGNNLPNAKAQQGSIVRETIEDILFKSGKLYQEECTWLADIILQECSNLNECNNHKRKEGNKEVDIDELWDEHSELIDDDIDSLSRWAGSTVMDKEQMKKAVVKLWNEWNNQQKK